MPIPPSNDETQVITQTVNGIDVVHSSDAGAYFCEHVYYATLAWNERHPNIIRSSDQGDVLAGFLHVPGR